MLNFVFWNIDERPIESLLAQLVHEHSIDVLCLAENASDPSKILAEIKSTTGSDFIYPDSDTPKIDIFCRSPSLGLNEVYADASGRLTIRKIHFDNSEFLLVATHLLDNRSADAEDRASFAKTMADQIRAEEARRENSQTILCGDLNMNPFEPALVHAQGLHAMPTKAIVSKKQRTIRKRDYPFFYNPMWGFLGDRHEEPPGTHYYRSGFVSYDWQLYDQVMFRADTLPWFKGNVEILTKINGATLAKASGRPNRKIGSDHFPVFFQLQSRS